MPLTDLKLKGLTKEQIKQVESSSWGSAAWNWIYLLAMQAYWQAIVYIIIMFVPVFNIVAWIIIITIGRKLAWENRHWSSFDEYIKVQKIWDRAGKIYYGILLSIAVISLIILGCISLSKSPNTTISLNNPTSYQATGLNNPVNFSQITVQAKDFRKVDSSEMTKYKQRTDCSNYNNNCETKYGYSIYALTLNFKNTGPKDFTLSRAWVSIEEDPSANSNVYLPNTYALYFEEINNHDIYEDFIIPSGGEKDVILPFRLQDDRTKITLNLKLYSDAQGKIILSLPK